MRRAVRLLAGAPLEGCDGRKIHRLADLCVGAQVHGAGADRAWKRERAVLRAAHAQWLADPGKATPLREGWGEVARLCTIFDMKGLTLSHALLPGGFNMVRQLIPLVQKNYPWLQDTTHFVNASGATSYAWSMLRPLLPKNTQRKVHIHGAGAAQSLTEEVRPDFLPEQLGDGRLVGS